MYVYTYPRPVIQTTRCPYNNCHVTSRYVASCCLCFAPRWSATERESVSMIRQGLVNPSFPSPRRGDRKPNIIARRNSRIPRPPARGANLCTPTVTSRFLFLFIARGDLAECLAIALSCVPTLRGVLRRTCPVFKQQKSTPRSHFSDSREYLGEFLS